MHRIWDYVSLLTARRLYTRRSTRGKTIYLTFDDGPDPQYTVEVLRLLKRYSALATFFLNGNRAERHREIVQQIVDQGHTIGNHSYSHTNMRSLTWRQQVEEITSADEILTTIDGVQRHLFRPPHGNMTVSTIALCILRRQRIVLWTHDSEDYQLNSEKIIRRLTDADIRAGDIILFHDDSDRGLEALEFLLPAWGRAGFEFAPL